jgi:N-methylhydantoinase A/oxoprolinase/acetone carboxylase beta subunit
MSVSEMINRTWKKLGEEAEQNFMSEGIPKRSVNFIRFVFMQYLGQLHDVEVMLPDITRIDSPDALKGVIAEFEKVYESIFGKEAKNPGAGYKITEIGLIAKAPKVKPQMRRYELGGGKPSKSSFKGTRKVHYKVRWQDAKIYEMEELVPGNEVHGLCIIESPYYTVFVPPGKKVVQDEFRLLNLIDVN